MLRGVAIALLAGTVLLALSGCTGGTEDAAVAPATSSPSTGSEEPIGQSTTTLVHNDEDMTEAAPIDSNGPGHLVDASDETGIDGSLLGIRGHAVATADINNDGWDDLFVGTFADRPVESYRERGADGPAPDRVLLGSPSGFTIDERFDGRLGRSAGAAFADLDNDGDPDLIVSRNVRDGERGQAPSEIYRNDNGRLVPATILDDKRGGRAVGLVDFDSDGMQDIVLVEDRWSGGSTGLFRNLGDLQFIEVGATVGFPDDVFGLGVAIGDLNGDGIDDLVIGGSNRWFLGDGIGFEEVQGSPLPWPLHGDEDDPAHVRLIDVDGDELLDIVIGQHFNSTIDAGIAEPVRLYINRGSNSSGVPTFEDVTEAAGLPALTTKSPQLVLLDLNGDGQRDLVLTASHGDSDGDRRPVVVTNLGTPGSPHFEAAAEESVGPHYWIDAVTLDANGDGRTDVFFVEWEPALGSKLFLNLRDSEN